MKHIAALLIGSIIFIKIPSIAFATSSDGIGCGGGMGPLATLFCNKDSASASTQAATSLNTLVSGIVTFMTIMASLWFMFQFILGAFSWISSGADKGALQMARDRMLHAVIGLVIVAASYVLIGLVGKVIGIDILNPGKMLKTVSLGA